jgi:hypothetical protein
MLIEDGGSLPCMDEYAPGISGEVRFSGQENGYYVVLREKSGKEVGRTGYYFSEAKAREAAKKLAGKLPDCP